MGPSDLGDGPSDLGWSSPGFPGTYRLRSRPRKDSEMPAPHPPEFRRRAVELAREVDEDGSREHPIAGLARDLKLSESCLRNWLAEDAVETGERPGLTKAEREELVRLRRENRVLRAERDLLSRAAAFFAQENVLPPRQ